MRTANILTLCALLCATNLVAQEGSKPNDYNPPTWAMIDDSLGHELGLTNEQMKLVQQADETYRENAKAGDATAMEKRDRDIKAVLLPSQYKEWSEVLRKRKEGPQ